MKKGKNKKIHKQMTISEVLEKYPEAEEIFFTYGLHCIGCAFSGDETIEAGAKAHGLEDDEIDEMVDTMNEIFEITTPL